MLIYNNQLYKKFYLLSKQPNAIRVEISEITNPTIDTLKKIAKALKVKVSDLLEE